MKKHVLLLIVAIFFISNKTFSQDISGSKPIIKRYYPPTNSYNNFTGHIVFDCGVSSAQVKATYTDIGSPDQYRVESIPYKPKPYARDSNFDGQITAADFVGHPGSLLSGLADDVWSSEQQLASGGVPLNFCFFGNQRTFFRLSTNGAVSFNTAGNYPTPPAYPLYNTGDFSPWQIHTMGKIAPNANMNAYRESILTPFHDTFPTHSSALPDTYSFWDILGAVGERYFILGFHHMPMYSCGNATGYATHQMIFFETTNIIEFHLQDKPICTNWAQGYAALGIQNKDLDLGYAAPGRDNLEHWQVLNTTDGFFDGNTDPSFPINAPESWRFIPDGPNGVAPVFTWYENYNHATQTGTPFGTNPHDPVLVVTSADMVAAGVTTVTYTAEVLYTDYCTGVETRVATDVTFDLANPIEMHIKEQNSTDDTIEFYDIEEIELCVGDNYTLEALVQNGDGTETFQWQVEQFPNTTQLGTNAIEQITNAQVGTYVYTVTLTQASTGCTFDDVIHVRVYPPDAVSFSYPAPGVYCSSDSDPAPINPVPANGIYTINNGGVFVTQNANGESTDGIIDLSASGSGNDNTGVFIITYTSLGCQNTSTQTITINDAPNIVVPTNNITQCGSGFATFDTASIEQEILNGLTGINLLWENNTAGGPAPPNPMTATFVTPTIHIKLTATDPANPAGCSTVIFFDLTVAPTPTAGTPTNNLILCENAPGTGIATFNGTNIENTIVGATPPANYQINFTGTDTQGNNVVIPSHLPANFNAPSMTVTATVTDTDTGCTSNQVTFALEVRDIPSITLPTTGLTLCETDPINHTAPFDTTNWTSTILSGNSTPINPDFIVEYTYYNGTINITTTTLPNPLVVGSQTISVITRNVTGGQQTCSSNASTFNLVVNPIPVGTNQTPTICSDDALNIDLTTITSGAGNTFSWIAADNPNVTGETLTASNNTAITDVLTNTSGVVQTVVYTVTPTGSNSCVGADFTVSVTVNPEPVGTATTFPACSNVAVSIDITVITSLAGNTYSWVATDNPNVTGETTVASTATNITDTLVNTSATAQNVIYTVTPTGANGCAGDPFIITINVGNEPVGTNQTPTVCSKDVLNLDLDSFVNLTGSSFSWTVADNPAVTGEFVGTSTATNITDTLINTSLLPQDVVYTVIPTSVNTCVGSSFTVTVTVNPEPVGTNQTPTTCSDQVLNLTLDSYTTLAGNTYSWIATDNPNVTGETTTATTGNTINDAITNLSGVNQTVIYTVTPTSAAGCVGADFTVSVTVNPEPVGTATTFPACSNVAVSIDITVITSLAGNTYSWVATDNPNVTGETTVASTATNITDTLVNTSATAQNVIYTVTPTGANGCAGDPFIITINVGNEPVGTNQTPTVCSKDVLNLDLDSFVNLTGSSFSWTVADNPAVTGEFVGTSTATNITDTLINTSLLPQDVVYTVIPTSVNTCVGSSFTVTVTVNPEPVGTNQTPTTCSDQVLNLTLDSYTTLAGNTYSWIATDNPNVTGETTTATTGNTINDTINNVSGVNQTVIYTVTPTSADGCVGADFTVSVTVGNEPDITDQNESTCSNVALGINLNSYTTLVGVAYSWIAADNPNVTGETTVASTTTAITDTLINTTTTAQIVIYTVTPTNGCTGNDFTVTVSVNPEPVGTVTQNVNACSDVAVDIDLEAYTSLTGNSYSWIATDNTNVTGETTTATTTSRIMDNITNTSGVPQLVTYTITPTSADGCVGNPFTIIVEVGQKPVEIAQAPTTICSNNALNIDLSTYTTLVANTYSWIAADNPDVTGETTTATTAAAITDLLRNKSLVQQTVTYTVTPTSSQGCGGSPFTVTVQVDPEPVGTPATETACSDVTLNIDLSNYTTLAGNTYSWIATDNPDVNGETIVATNSSTITDTLTNVSGVNQDVIYTVTPTSANGCIGESFIVTVHIGEEPVGTATTETACSNVALDLDLSDYTSLSGNTYSWIADDNPNVTGESTTTMSTVKIDDVIINTSGTLQNVIYRVTPTSSNGCVGNEFIVTVEVGFEPVGTNQTETICNNGTLNLDLSTYTTLTGNSYEWVAIENQNVEGETTSVTNSPIINDMLTNTSGAIQSVDYQVTPTSAGNCVGSMFIVSVDVYPRPEFELKDQYFICPDAQTDTTIGEVNNPSGYTYEWFVATDMTTVINNNADDRLLDVNEADITANGGIYALRATDANGCTHTKLTSVGMAEQFEITNVYVDDFNRPNNTITIEVTGGSGAYEYTLTDANGNATTQVGNPVFENVLASTYQIEVTDITGCSEYRYQDDIFVLDYPPFFTPNGDLKHDTWQITGANLIPDSIIYIFDRYGKKIAQVDPKSTVGWDGLYNGKQMPASDYWFTAQYIDPNNKMPKTVKGHFSIIRR